MTEELDRRRAKMRQIAAAMDADRDFVRDRDLAYGLRDTRRSEALDLLAQLRDDRDVEAFRVGVEEWSRRPGFESFGGFNGQMFLNQLVKSSLGDEDALVSLFLATLVVPTSEAEARQKLEMFTQHVESVRKGAHPAPGRVAFFVSFFWALADEDVWPAMWNSAEEMLKALGWLTGVADPPERYLDFRAAYLSVASEGSRRTESALYWLDSNRFAGLDPALLERCAENAALLERWTEVEGYGRAELDAQAQTNARSALGELRLLGLALADEVSAVLGRPVRLPGVQTRTAMGTNAPFRADAYTTWVLQAEGDTAAPGFRVWATRSGVAVGLHAGYADADRHREVAALASRSLPEGIGFIEIRDHASGDRLRPVTGTLLGDETFIGRWFPAGDALDRQDFRADVLATVTQLKPLLDTITHGTGTEETPASGPTRAGSELAAQIEAFTRGRPYPQDKDRWHHDQREALAARLTPESLEQLDLDTFRALINGQRYGNPGPQSRLNAFLGSATREDLARLGHAVRYLLWGEDDEVTRIDRVLDQADLGVSGLGESVVLKLLAVVHPDRYLPVFPYTGPMGKLAMLDLLQLDHPDPSHDSAGSRQLAANDALRRTLSPHLDDAWGMGQFLYWKRAQDQAAPRGSEDVLGRLAEDVLLEESFLQEVVSLLRDRGQVVLYGPPGTGKTFLARRLAEMLVPDATRRVVVQFHPSTSYEDFVEGFRPDVSGDTLTYRLVKGPLARLAEAAEEAPGVDHVLVIDELNRANLPRVFGELLYLLEYRGDGVSPLYRPDELFVLPKNVLVIGTMNTADRSIALVDAALRRRFHFVPLLPDTGPLTGLLERWLQRHGEPVWVADLVAMINDELEERLGGPHLTLGPSYFMQHGIDADRLRRIWTYDVYPRIEEHLYGDWDELKRYRWPEVLRRFRLEQPTLTDASDGSDGSDGSDLPAAATNHDGA